MQIVRTIIWVLLLVALLLFSIANWSPTVTVRIWEGLVVDTKIPAIVVVSFLIGFVPMWLFHRASKWQLKRRIAGLEASARTVHETPVVHSDVAEDRAEVREARAEAREAEAEAEIAEERATRERDLPDGRPRL